MGNIASKPYIYPTVGVVYLHEWLDASLYLPTFGWGKSNKNHPNLGSDPNVKAVGLQARPGPWQFGLPRPKDATSKVVEETSGRALVLWNCPSTWEDETPRIWNKGDYWGKIPQQNLGWWNIIPFLAKYTPAIELTWRRPGKWDPGVM